MLTAIAGISLLVAAASMGVVLLLFVVSAIQSLMNPSACSGRIDSWIMVFLAVAFFSSFVFIISIALWDLTTP